VRVNFQIYTDSKKSCQSLEDCGELHENEASQVNFSRENFEIVYIF
jgi:hypothetical protein